MKKIILTITAIAMAALLAAPAVRAQDFNDVYKKYRDSDNITRVHIPKAGIMFAGLFLNGKDDYEAKTLLRATNSLKLIAVENGYNEQLERDVLGWIQRHGLEPMVSVSDEEGKVDVYVLDDGKAIRHVVVMVNAPDEQSVAHLKGRYTHDMLKALAAGESGINVNGVDL